MERYFPARIWMSLLIASSLQGCATSSTISEAQPGFKVEPPKKPLLDLPFSMLFDTGMLPSTFSISGYEALFGAD